jgi:biopolymer transport protein ExbD
MAINPTLRMTVLTLLPLFLSGAAHGAEGPTVTSKSVDYQRADTNFYAKDDVLKADPSAVILPPTAFAQNGGTYTFTPKKKAPKTIYIEIASDWVEPITPPDLPASLNIAPDAMQIREPQGDVEVALPNAPASFSPVTDGMALPNGAVIKTGTNATAAILFGGVDSARLMPDSEAAVQQTITATSRAVEVDLTAGGVFSKVGTQVGVTGQFQVHTPFGNAIAQAGDFATLALAGRCDIWVSQGTIDLLQPDGKKFGAVTAGGAGPLKLICFPVAYPGDPGSSVALARLRANADSLTAILNFIPVANQKLAALHARQAKGTPLSANEDAYLQRIKQVPALIKLALVEPPAPPPPPVAVAPTPPVTPTAPPQPVTVIIHANGTIKFQGATMGLEEFQARIKTLVAAHPDQAIVIRVSPKADYAKFTAIVDACKNAPFKEVAVTPPAPQPPRPAAAPPAPAPVAVTPAVPATPTVNPDVTVVPGKIPAAAKPLTVLVHEDGSVGFQGRRGSLPDFKARLAAVLKATPDREFDLKTSGPKVPYARIKAVLDACSDAHVAHVSAPPPPAVPVPLPVTAETPPTPAPPAPVNDKPVPAEIDLAADGTLALDGSPVTEDDLKTKLADLKKTNPKNPLVMMKQPKVTKDQWMRYVDLCHSLGLRLLVKNAKPVAPEPAAPILRPAAAEGGPFTQPPPPAPHLSASPAPEPSAPAAADAAVPVEIELTPDGQISFLGEVVSPAELKSRLQGVAQGNTKEPVLIVKDEKVTHDQWQQVVDICHAAKLKVRIKTVKSSDSGALKPRAQNSSTAVTVPAKAAAPERIASSAGGKIIPVEIDLAPEGRMTFEGASVDVDQLEIRLARFAKADPTQPVLIVKQADVADDSLEALVTLCQAVSPRFRVTIKTAKSFLPPPPPLASPDTSPAENLPAPSVRMHPSLDGLGSAASSPSP